MWWREIRAQRIRSRKGWHLIHRKVLGDLFLLMVIPGSSLISADQDKPAAWWKFDEGSGATVFESVSRTSDSILGHFAFVEGINRTGLKCDGFTTRILRRADRTPRFDVAFTVEAWILPQAYPWNWCAIADQEKERRSGYFFGIDAYGHVGLHLSVDGQWVECTSQTKIPYMTWSHVAATFDQTQGITVYTNGMEAGRLDVKGRMHFAGNEDLQIGRSHEKMPPTDLVRKKVSFPASYSFDGIIDELKMYDKILSARQIKKIFDSGKPDGAPALAWRKWPRLTGPSRFGAVYTRLAFFEEWDKLWKVDEFPDVVVSFDSQPGKMVFWRGTNYNMNMVTENEKWVGDQSAEGGRNGTIGCCEHMSDKQCRYAHVRILENNDARVVVHWRYALNDVLYRITGTDAITEWGDWADEYYTITPDGVAVRHFQIHGSDDEYSITEPAALNQPGERAEDNLYLQAVVLANMKGETRSYTWDPWPGSGKVAADFLNPLPNANICVVNFQSAYKPFYIYDPGTRIIPYGGGLVEVSDFSHFPTWNHWPVAQPACDGRIARSADQFTSSAVTSPEPPMVRNERGAMEGSFLMGLTDQAFETLALLARSWLQAPELTVMGEGYRNEGYNKHERAFVLNCDTAVSGPIEIEIAAGKDSPVVNPTFVVRNWGDTRVKLEINGMSISRGRDFRFGHRMTMSGSDLVAWVRFESIVPIRIRLIPD